MEVITLSQEEITKYQVIKDSLDRKISNNQETKETILNLYLNTYNGFNVSHFGEFLKEAHGIDVSRETLRNLLLNSGLRCKAKSQPKHRSRRTRMPKSGLLIQMDSSRASVVKPGQHLAY